MIPPHQPSDRSKVLVIVVSYAVLTTIWLCAADILICTIFTDPAQALKISTIKDITFCLLTVFLLYKLVSNQLSESQETGAKLLESKIRLETLVSSLEDSRAALQTAHQRLELVADGIPGLIAHVDSNERYLYVNRNYAAWIGRPASEIIGRTAREIIGKETYASTSDAITRVLAGEHVTLQRVSTIDGSERHQHISLVPQHNEQGDVNAYFALISDITDIKTIERKLYAAERKFREVLENITMIAVILDRDGTVTFCNDYLLHVTGLTRDRVIDRNWFDLFVRPESRQPFELLLNANGFAAQSEIPLVTSSGTTRHIAWNVTPLHDSRNTMTACALTGVDLTEHRLLEEQLRQANKMEAIGTLAGGIAHDFNNLMTIIMASAEMLSLVRDPDKNTIHTFAQQIIDCVNRGSGLTRSLLAFSRSQAIDFKPIDLNKQLSLLMGLIPRIIGEDITVEIDCCAHSLNVVADATQIDQVILNMVSNARDAMPHGGLLKVTSSAIRRDSSVPDCPIESEHAGIQYAVVEISDTGTGMPPETVSQIFDPFFTTKDVGKGTGLGLAMAYGIIASHHGFIDVESEPGKGTTFRIHLPLASTDSEPTMIMTAELPTGQETLLLVEDDEQLRQILKKVIEKQGYRVITAQNGKDGVDVFLKHGDSIHLILSDIVMPKMDGFEMVREIRTISAVPIPIIFMSGYAAHLAERLKEPGISAQYLAKPLKLPELMIKIREQLQLPPPQDRITTEPQQTALSAT